MARLGGSIDERFEPKDWREDTPVGSRRIPPAVQAVLSVSWPEGHSLVTEEDVEYDEEPEEVTFPQLAHGDPIADDRAFFIIAFNESTQHHWVIDLDDEHPDDPMVHVIDHDRYGGHERFRNPRRLSHMLGTLVAG